eukprot:96434-Pyramimonas_sp.AAC.1
MADSEALRAALEEVPVHYEQDGDDVLIAGLPGELIRTLVEENMEQGSPNWCAPYRRPCSCAFKTALVPAGHHEWWRDLM